MTDVKDPVTKTPFFFQEEKNQVYYHDLMIFIQGADVTPYLTSQVVLTRADRNGISSLTFQLSNAYRAFEMTKVNLGYDDPDTKIDEATGKSTKKNDAGNTVPGTRFRMFDPKGPSGAYSELAKATIYNNKISNNADWQHCVAKYGPSVKERGTVLVDRDNATNAENSTDATTGRYQFAEGGLVFHKYDPVRFFVLNPLQSGDDEWTCEFTGYIETKPYSQNYINGHSVINVTCQDIRTVMQSTRAQTNSSAQYGNEKMFFYPNDKRCVNNTPEAGLFADFRIKRATGHPLYGETFLQSARYLTLGFVENKSRKGQIGKLTEGITLRYNPQDSKEKKYATLEKWNNIINFGSWPLPVAVDAEPTAPEGAEQSPDGGPPPDEDLEETPQGEAAKKGTLGDSKNPERFLKKFEAIRIGQETRDGGTFSPDVARVHFLLPQDIDGVSNLLEGSMVDGRAVIAVEWSTRLEVIVQLCKAIDYQFYVTGMGDVVFEFPMYDFMPTDFGKTYQNLFSFEKHVISDNINDEGGTPLSALEATSRTQTEQFRADPSNPQGGLQNWELRSTAFSNVLASRIGIHVETMSLPGITNHERLSRYALLEFNKRLANYDKMDMVVSYRPFMLLNRPVYHATKSRVALCDSFTYTWRIRQDVSLEINLSYVRKREGDVFRFISGGQRLPISYSTVYDTLGKKYNNGVAVINTKTAEEPNVVPGTSSKQSKEANKQ